MQLTIPRFAPFLVFFFHFRKSTFQFHHFRFVISSRFLLRDFKLASRISFAFDSHEFVLHSTSETVMLPTHHFH